jgi:hypothetical protein
MVIKRGTHTTQFEAISTSHFTNLPTKSNTNTAAFDSYFLLLESLDTWSSYENRAVSIEHLSW